MDEVMDCNENSLSNGILEVHDSETNRKIKSNSEIVVESDHNDEDTLNEVLNVVEKTSDIKENNINKTTKNCEDTDNLNKEHNTESNLTEQCKDSSECNKTDCVNDNKIDNLNDKVDNLIDNDNKIVSLNDGKTESLNDSNNVENSPKDSNKTEDLSSVVEETSLSPKAKNSENLNSNESNNTAQKDAESQENKLKNDVKAKETESKENQDSTEGSKKKEESSGKKKKGKTCVECGKKRKIEFRIHFQGKVHALCSETCYKQFKEKQSAPKPAPPPEPPKVPEPVIVQDSFCPECQKLIFPNQGYYPVVGEVKPLCSEDCVRKYQDNNGPPRKCSQCDTKVEDKSCHLTWETMVFCSEDCLGKYQSFLGSHCTCCQAPVQQSSLGKYCVCFGSDIRQFCSGSCLDDFKKGLKVCTFCQTDLSAGSEGFLAPVGDKGQFKDFCTQACMERYETMNNISKSTPDVQECAHCKKIGSFKIQVTHEDVKYFLCCDNCVAGLRCFLKKKNNVCASCHTFFDCSSDLNGNKLIDYKLKLDGLYKFFCSKTCMTTYVLSHRRITQCLFCKVKKYNFDMIEKTDRSVGSQMFCSLNCLSLYRVNVNAASAKSIRCDNCAKSSPAQYHLTMSDGSIRNFCTYSCVLAFQNQFTTVPALTTTSMTRQITTPVQTLKTTSAVSSPVIANVVSLAQPRTGTPTLTKTLVPQTLVSVRPTRPPVAVFTTKPQVTSSSTTTSIPVVQPTVTNSSSQVVREVIVQPPAPKSVKNKTVWCKPIMLTKGINAKTPACNKAVQTDDNPRPLIFPIPVPVYVPTPLHMFSRPVPCPVPFPVPIPIPVLIPSSKDSHTQVIKHLRQIQGNMSSHYKNKEVMEKTDDESNKSLSDIDKQSESTNQDVQTIEGSENDADSISKQTRNSKREHSPFKHEKHKKAKLTEELDVSREQPTAADDSSLTSQPLSSSVPDTSNSHFETPSFSFEDDEQTLLKVP